MRRRHSEEFQSFTALGLGFLSFNTKIAPFDDARVRKALSLAIDRDAFSSQVARGLFLPATGGMIPPGVPGHLPGIAPGTDVLQARKLLSEAGFPDGKAFPVHDFYINRSNESVGMGEFFSDQLSEQLNIKIKPVALNWKEAMNKIVEDYPAIGFGAWSADYPDPDSFLYSPWWFTKGGWSNPEYLDLMQRARSMMNQAERMALYRQAEMIILDEVPVSPMVYGTYDYFVKPWVRKFSVSPLADIPMKEVILDPELMKAN
jgi:oligopeptide transport system substrate-binding protein